MEEDERRRQAEAAFVPRHQRDNSVIIPSFGHGGLRQQDGESARSVAEALQQGATAGGEERPTKKAKASQTGGTAPQAVAAGPMAAPSTAAEAAPAGSAYVPPPHWDPQWVRPEDIHGHHLFKAGPVLFCAICGSYGSSSFVRLNEDCTGPPRRTERLRRLQQGKDPNADRWLGTVRRALKTDIQLA